MEAGYYLVMPASNAMSERSFSTLRRVKTYLRSTMRQDRLNYLMILHVHKERTDALDLKEVANECGSEHRYRIFGKFLFLVTVSILCILISCFMSTLEGHHCL